MPDLIDREALHQRINKMELWIPLDENSADSIVTCALHNARWILNLLDDMPTIEAEPVKHGRWVVKGQDIFCSVCDKESAYNWHGASKWSDYCPNCGAKMDEEVSP